MSLYPDTNEPERTQDPSASTEECPGCGYADKCRCAEIVQDYLNDQGWKFYPNHAGGIWYYHVPGNDDLIVEIDPGYGYAWQIRQFTDGDIDGVAVGRYEPIPDAEGDTVRELLKCIEDIRMKASERASDARTRREYESAQCGDFHDSEED